MKRYYLDLFRSNSVDTARRSCSFSIDQDVLDEINLFQEGKPSDVERVEHVFSMKNADRENLLINNVTAHCNIPIKSYDYLCLRDGKLSEQGGNHHYRPHGHERDDWYAERKKMSNQCVVFMRDGDAWRIDGQLAEYTHRGSRIKLYDILNHLPVKERTIEIDGKKVTVDAGIATWINELNDEGYETLFSDSGLTTDHYGRRINSYVSFTVPRDVSNQEKESFISCLRNTVNESGHDVEIDIGKDKVTIYFARKSWWASRDDMSDHVRDQRIKNAWSSFDRVLEKNQCTVLQG